MSRMRLMLRDAAGRIPYPLARLLVWVPFPFRLGRQYSIARKQIDQFDSASSTDQEVWILDRLREIVGFAYAKTTFYRHWYDRHHFSPDRLRSLAHFQDVPLVTKQDLRSFALEQRSGAMHGALRLNTGGTSGEPLDFYVDSNAFAREWAHMHCIWEAGGYRQRDLKLTLRGKHLGRTAIRYNVVHNEYVANAYIRPGELAEALHRLPRSRRIRWFHGYPSLVAEFAGILQGQHPELLARLRRDIKGVLLGSEYPAPHYRQVIEDVLTPNVVAWYGHSEMAVLAREQARDLYAPLQTYGYCEAIADDAGQQKLVGTSYWNRASPFIRYDTGDLVRADPNEPLLRRFQMAEGRIGDFVECADGTRIALTALIFGRHHPAFEMIDHVQVRQDQPGAITVVVVPKANFVNQLDLVTAGFHVRDVGLSIHFEFVPEPIRTARGKTPLLIRSQDSEP